MVARGYIIVIVPIINPGYIYMTIKYTQEALKESFNKNMTRDSSRACARRLGLNPVGLKKIEIENMVIDHVLKWGLEVPDEYMMMHRKTRGRPKKLKLHIQTQT